MLFLFQNNSNFSAHPSANQNDLHKFEKFKIKPTSFFARI